MNHKRLFLFGIFLLISLLAYSNDSYGKANEKAIDVSIIQLIARPENYQGKIVRVIGVVCIGFETNSILLSKDDYKYGLSKNGLWIEPDYSKLEISEKELQKYNGMYVLVEGIFDLNDQGHFGMWSGSIQKINRFMVWEK